MTKAEVLEGTDPRIRYAITSRLILGLVVYWLIRGHLPRPEDNDDDTGGRHG